MWDVLLKRVACKVMEAVEVHKNSDSCNIQTYSLNPTDCYMVLHCISSLESCCILEPQNYSEIQHDYMEPITMSCMSEASFQLILEPVTTALTSLRMFHWKNSTHNKLQHETGDCQAPSFNTWSVQRVISLQIFQAVDSLCNVYNETGRNPLETYVRDFFEALMCETMKSSLQDKSQYMSLTIPEWASELWKLLMMGISGTSLLDWRSILLVSHCASLSSLSIKEIVQAKSQTNQLCQFFSEYLHDKYTLPSQQAHDESLCFCFDFCRLLIKRLSTEFLQKTSPNVSQELRWSQVFTAIDTFLCIYLNPAIQSDCLFNNTEFINHLTWALSTKHHQSCTLTLDFLSRCTLLSPLQHKSQILVSLATLLSRWYMDVMLESSSYQIDTERMLRYVSQTASHQAHLFSTEVISFFLTFSIYFRLYHDMNIQLYYMVNPLVYLLDNIPRNSIVMLCMILLQLFSILCHYGLL